MDIKHWCQSCLAVLLTTMVGVVTWIFKAEPLHPGACLLVDCVWNDWVSWDACTGSCGGSKQRMRTFKIQAENGGAPCAGSATQKKLCAESTSLCPVVDCAWSLWAEWSPCTTTCGEGSQRRNRSVAQSVENGGRPCIGNLTVTQSCALSACPVLACVWESWGPWGDCSASCGSGSKKRERKVAVQPGKGGVACMGNATDTQSCTESGCPVVDCAWGLWAEWSACTTTCGEGSQRRNRSVAASVENGSVACMGNATDTQSCTLSVCPVVDCAWGQWTDWSPCSTNCGEGSKQRIRTVAQSVENGGLACVGDAAQNLSCTLSVCPVVDCAWGQWTDWSTCTTTCGGGSKQRTRSVAQSVENGGVACVGNAAETQSCADLECPVDTGDAW